MSLHPTAASVPVLQVPDLSLLTLSWPEDQPGVSSGTTSPFLLCPAGPGLRQEPWSLFPWWHIPVAPSVRELKLAVGEGWGGHVFSVKAITGLFGGGAPPPPEGDRKLCILDVVSLLWLHPCLPLTSPSFPSHHGLPFPQTLKSPFYFCSLQSAACTSHFAV